MFRSIIHIALHIIVPGAVARYKYAGQWKRVWAIMVSAIIVDLDHLLANPVYDPNRCGIGFHPLHSYLAIGAYVVLTVIPKTRIIGLGLVIHMFLDGLDCIWMLSGN
jgi:hypothetical protein